MSHRNDGQFILYGKLNTMNVSCLFVDLWFSSEKRFIQTVDL